MRILLASTFLTMGLISMAPSAMAAECGSVTIASMNWSSAELLASVDNFILKNGYDCQSEIVPGDTVPTLTSMAEKGQPDLAPEIWTSLRPPVTETNIAEGKLIVAGRSFVKGGIQGVYVPKFIVDEHPDIKTIADAVKHPELFPNADDPSRAAWSAGPQGWGGTVVASQYYKAYDIEKAGFALVDTGSAAGHDGSIIHAYEAHKGWIGYYWEPTALLGKYEMVRLPAGVPVDRAEWDRCNKVDNCADPRPNEWPADDVDTIVSQKFAERAGPALDYLGKRTWPNEVINKMLSWMSDNQATGEDGAKHFLKEFPDVWKPWVGPEVAAKIEAAL